jgi:hypothetical protein
LSQAGSPVIHRFYVRPVAYRHENNRRARWVHREPAAHHRDRDAPYILRGWARHLWRMCFALFDARAADRAAVRRDVLLAVEAGR